MNGFRNLQERLRKEGWYVGWNLPCCQSCAWGELPYEFEDGTEIDFDKVLFNHSQDCEIDHDYEDCDACDGDGVLDDDDCGLCDGEGFRKIVEDVDFEPDASVYGFVCSPPEHQSYSMFCFSGDRKGVANLKKILPIIEECGCSWSWNKKKDQRIEISWEI